MGVGSPESARFALDVQGLDRLRHSAGRQPKQQLARAAKQFEALFLNHMMKSMRDAGFKSDLTDSKQMQFYQSLFDQQMAQQMAGKGVGLADMLIAQLSGGGQQVKAGESASAGPVSGIGAATAARLAAIPHGTPRRLTGAEAVPISVSKAPETPKAAEVEQSARAAPARGSQNTGAAPGRETICDHFVRRFAGPAQAAARQSGVPARLILAQAALETGWGRHGINTDGGVDSHNLFGIKAGGAWRGATTDTVTHEYVGGRRVSAREPFRVYRSYHQAFTDHARLIGDNPRYAPVRDAATPEQAARALQDCGYATDPQYANKLIAIMNRIGSLSGHG